MDDIMVTSMILVWVVVGFNLLLTLVLVRRVTESGRGTHSARPAQGLPVGQTAPPFQATTLDEQPVTQATYAGRSVAFVFISTGCGPCLEALPSLETAWQQAARAGVAMALVSTDDAVTTRAFVDEHQVRMPVLIAPRSSNPFMQDYALSQTPSYCLLDAQGRVQSVGHPTTEWGEWKTLTESWAIQAPRGVPMALGVGR